MDALLAKSSLSLSSSAGGHDCGGHIHPKAQLQNVPEEIISI